MTTRNKNARRRLRCENLECRRMMAADTQFGVIAISEQVDVAALHSKSYFASESLTPASPMDRASRFDSTESKRAIESFRVEERSQVTDQEIIDALNNRTQFSDFTRPPVGYNQTQFVDAEFGGVLDVIPVAHNSFFDVFVELDPKALR